MTSTQGSSVCPHCGTPMTTGAAFVCAADPRDSGVLELPPVCPSRECRKARDEAAIQRAIDSGLIDP